MLYDITEGLSLAQRQAVECCDAPSLVIAGAGAGKTRVLTCKIAWLIGHEGLPPWSILALTFTNKAAREMQERISRQVGNEVASQLWMGTFHSIFARILRIESARLGLTSDFTIYDATDSKNMVKTILREMGLNDKQYKPATVCAHISSAKNALILPADYRNNISLMRRDAAASMPATPDIYQRYVERCRQSNAMDFDDLLLRTWMLFRDCPDVAAKYQEKFRFVLVDEYQDTNYAQHQIVWQLTNQRQRVCVVGDDAQSIYSFRGANIDNILNFQQMYNGARLFKLEQNYRSTQNIVGAANSLIRHNLRQIHKEVFSQNDVGMPVEVCQAYSDVDEANIVARRIRRFVRSEHVPYGQQAVLYRTNAQSRSLEETLRREGIPYRIYGGLSFYQRKEVKDLIAYFRLSVNPNDEEALRRVINYPARGIGQTTLNRLFEVASQQGVSAWDVLQAPDLSSDPSLIGRGGKGPVLQSFAQLIESFHAEAATSDAWTMAIRIARESGLKEEVFRGHEPEDISRQENLQELLDGISAFVQERSETGGGTLLTHYLQEVSLLSDVDEDDTQGDDKVTLMTVHSAKGLEFQTVFVAGMEEGLFPSEMSTDNPRQIEEERRLFYVAMTRAKSHLVIIHARSRFRYGRMEFGAPSRFLHEIDPRFLSVSGKNERPSRPNAVPNPHSHPPFNGQGERFGGQRLTPLPKVSLSTTFTKPSFQSPFHGEATGQGTGSLSPGTVIIHDRFGRGVVERVEGTGIDAKATVCFDNAGQKQLLLRFAKYKVE